ncbi:MAG TPA: glycosyltransferase [Ktedonobacterales bacterium]
MGTDRYETYMMNYPGDAGTQPRMQATPYRRPVLTSELETARTATRTHYEVAVLIPCYNEALTIGSVIRGFREALPYARIYVFDNNSKDDTARIAAEAGAIVCYETLQGKGNVVRRMFRDVEADLYVMVDGDGTYDPRSAIDMIELAISGPYDMVNGVRVSEKGKPAYRTGHQFGNALLTGMVKFLFGNRIEDMLSGYKVFSRRYVKSFPSLSKGFEIETELTVHALGLQMPISHMRTVYGGRPKGSHSKLNTYRDGRKILLYILDLFRQERPLLFFSLISFFLTVAALAISVPLAITYFQTGLVPRFPTLFVTVSMLLLACISFTSGLILDTITRGRQETKMMNYLRVPAMRSE